MSIENALIEVAQTTSASVMVTSRSRLVSPAKTLVVWTMGRDSSCKTLNPPPVCAALMSFLEYIKEGRSAKENWQMYSEKDLLLSNICKMSRANGSIVDTFFRIKNPTTIIKKVLEGLRRSGLRVCVSETENIVKYVRTVTKCSENLWLRRAKLQK